MRRLLAFLFVVLLLCACSPDKGFGETKEVSVDDYGAAWPLRVDSALLTCDQGGFILVQVRGNAFRIDDLAYPHDAHPNFLRLWASDPSQATRRKDLSPLIDDGEALCG